MHISKFRIQNYKSYLDSEDVNLESGINIITGQNNAGKTALLQALSLNFGDNPHRSIHTISNPVEQVNPQSSLQVTFSLTKDDFRTYIFNYFDQLLIPKSHVSGHSYSKTLLFSDFLRDENSLNVKFLKGGSYRDVDVTEIPTERSNQNYAYSIDKKTSYLHSLPM